jgi:hypothetical protein
VKLGKNASDIHEMFCKAYGGETIEKSRVLTGTCGSKLITRTWKLMKEIAVQNLIEPMKMLNCRNWFIQIDV